jgi:hypothetical protein
MKINDIITEGSEQTVDEGKGDPCWDNYKQIGMKKGKGGKMVPDCRGPIKEQGVAEGSRKTITPEQMISDAVEAYKREAAKEKPNPYILDSIKANINDIKREIERKKQGVAEGAPIVVAQAPIHIRNPKKQQSRQDKPLTAYQQGVAAQGKPYKNPHPFDPKAGADVNYDHNQYRAGYKKQGVAEGSKVKTAKGHGDVVQGTNVKTVAKADLGKNKLNLPKGYGDVVQPQKLKSVAKAQGVAGRQLEETYHDDDEFFEAYGVMEYNDEMINEAEYQGRKVTLNKPMQGDIKKFSVYVKNEKGNVVKVNFGQKGARIKKNNPGRRKNFRARHNCDNPGPKTSARYWSCRKW